MALKTRNIRYTSDDKVCQRLAPSRQHLHGFDCVNILTISVCSDDPLNAMSHQFFLLFLPFLWRVSSIKLISVWVIWSHTQCVGVCFVRPFTYNHSRFYFKLYRRRIFYPNCDILYFGSNRNQWMIVV